MNKFPDLKKFSHLASTFFGAGLLPKAPGTWGSFVALLFIFWFDLCTDKFLTLFYFFYFFFYCINNYL